LIAAFYSKDFFKKFQRRALVQQLAARLVSLFTEHVLIKTRQRQICSLVQRYGLFTHTPLNFPHCPHIKHLRSLTLVNFLSK